MKKLFNFLLVFSIFANVYSVPSLGVGFGELIMIALMPLLLINLKGHLKVTRATGPYIFFMFYALLITMINVALFSEIDTSETIKRLVRNFYYVLLFFYFSRYYFDYAIARKSYSLFCVLLSLLVIVQFICFVSFGYYISGLIPGLDVDTSMMDETTLKTAEYSGYLRPRGFLSEPANCAHCLALAVLLEVIPYNSEKPNYKKVALFLLAMVLTTSANAYVAILVAAGLWFWNGMKQRSESTNKVILISVLTIFVLFIIKGIESITIISDVAERFATLDEATDNSAGVRLFRGPAFWANMNPLGQLFGIGFGNFIGYRQHFQIWTVFEEESEYMASMPDYLVSVGLIGFVLLLYCIAVSMKGKHFKNKSIMIMLLVMSISSSIAHTAIWVLYISFALWGVTSLEKNNHLKVVLR